MKPGKRPPLSVASRAGTAGSALGEQEASAAVRTASPRQAERWARSQAVLEASLGRNEVSAWSMSVRCRQEALGALHLGHARRWQLSSSEVPGPLKPVPEPEPLTAAHVFDWASLTKVVGSQALLMQLVAEGRLSVDMSVRDLDLGLDIDPKITIGHLLRYASGWPAWRPLYALCERGPPSADELPLLLAQLPQEARPGERRLYSDLGHIALGFVLTKVLGQSLCEAFAARIASPLCLRQAGYLPGVHLRGPAVATGHGNVFERRMLAEPDFGMPAARKGLGPVAPAWRSFRAGSIVGEVDDGNAHYLLHGEAGHAGLFGTAEELALLAEGLAVPSEAAARLGLNEGVQRSFLQADEHGRLLSWWPGHELGLPELGPPEPGAPAKAVMIRGFTGTMVYVEPATGLVVAMLSNREHVDGTGQYINLRSVFAEVVAIWRAV